MDDQRQIAFGYSTKCNVKCDHCVAANELSRNAKMELNTAKEIIEEMAYCKVKGISFTAGEPLLFLNDIRKLIELCNKNRIYSRVVTNGFWAKTQEHADNVVSDLLKSGLSQLRISFSRWHQKNISRENIVNAASSCQKNGLDYFISFVTDFSEHDDPFELFLRDNDLMFFPEPLIYFGNAGEFDRPRIFTDYQPNTCAMNSYLTPDLEMFPKRKEPLYRGVIALVYWWNAQLSTSAVEWLRGLPDIVQRDETCLVHDTQQARMFPESHAVVGLDEKYWEFCYHGAGIAHNMSSEVLGHLTEFMTAHQLSRVFAGHTHTPFYHRAGQHLLCNAGSVGMPLDGDPRASLVLAHARPRGEWGVEIRRIRYDIDEMLRRVDAASDYPDFTRSGIRAAYKKMLKTGIYWRLHVEASTQKTAS